MSCVQACVQEFWTQTLGTLGGMSRYSKSTSAKRPTANGFLVPCMTCGKPSTTSQCEKHRPVAQRSDLRSRLIHERQVKSLRPKVLKRDNWSCVDCGIRDKTGKTLECDHIIPWADGGEAAMENLATRCVPCHREKTKAQSYKKGKSRRANPMR